MPSASSNNPRLQRAPFIVLEGVDGSGKSTQAQLLSAWLQEQGFATVETREPGGTALAERLRSIILDPTIACASRTELLLILAARAQHVAEVIAPALEAGKIVISDRFSLSSYAYQGYGRGIALDEIKAADSVATGGVVPTVTLLLDMTIDKMIARIGERQDRFEGEGRAFLQRVIDGYRELAAKDPTICVVDGTQSMDDVQNAIRQAVQPVLAEFMPAGG
ncbi:MAG TPA: dTMP kinase [Armatimonadota bacterium]|nr:dTMP kinase [Armatimonadota bacterium]